MGRKLMGLLMFGVLFVFGMFTYYPFSDGASLTNNPEGFLEVYSVDSNWSDEGTLENLVSNGDIVYAESNQVGNWTGFVQDEPNSRTISLEADGDPRDGTVTFYINAWEDLPNGGSPDNTYVTELDDFQIDRNFTVEEYDYFNVVIEIEETGGSSNQRPRVDSFSVEFLNRSDQIGLTQDDFQVLTFFVFIGSGLIALTRWI